MNIHPEEETAYTTQHEETLLKYVEIAHCAKHGRLLIIEPKTISSNNLVPPATTLGSGQSSFTC